ncbi:MAG: hypothetical protein AAGE61_22205, partial [Pseudomonadota bacterium]
MTSLIGIVSIFEVSKAVHLHDLNFLHLRYSERFKARVETTDFSSKPATAELRNLIYDIRSQPIDCLKSRNWISTLGTMAFGTYEAFSICERDVALADRALAYLDRLERGEIPPNEASAEISTIASQFSQNSDDFYPLVTRTVNSLLAFMLAIMVLKGASAVLVTVQSSRYILRQFDRALDMDQELQAKNKELSDSIVALKNQKQEIDEAKSLAEHNALHDALTDLPN